MKPGTITGAAVLLVSMGLSGCTHLSLPYLPHEPTVAALPVQAAGVRDGRASFAALMSQQLLREGRVGSTDAWLHVPARAQPAAVDAGAVPPGTSVLVVPGIFGDCVADQSLPFSDGVTRPIPRNYTEGYEHYAHLGLAGLRALEVPGRASSSENAVRIAEEILAESARPGVRHIVLVAYSKGLPDTLMALDRLAARGSLPRQVAALVSVSGVLLGTPIADHYGRLYAQLAAPFTAFECSRSTGGEVDSLTRRERLSWLAEHAIPGGIRLYSVVAHAPRASIAPALRPFNEQLTGIDPKNDGQVLAAWSILPGSLLLAEVRSDHWTYVLPLTGHPNHVIRSMAARADFPRSAFFSALLVSVGRELPQ